MKVANYNPQYTDDGVCQYGECDGDVPDYITVRLCEKHLQIAYAAYLIHTGAAIGLD